MNSIPPIATTGLIIFSVLFVVSSILMLIWRVLGYRYRLRMYDMEHAPKAPDVSPDIKRPPSAAWTRISPQPYLVQSPLNHGPPVHRKPGPNLATKPLPRAPETPQRAAAAVERSYFDADDESEDDHPRTSKERLVSRLVPRPARALSRNRLSTLPSSLAIARGRVAREVPAVRLGPAARVGTSPLQQTARVQHMEDVPIVSTPRDLQINMGNAGSPKVYSPSTDSLNERYGKQPGDVRNSLSRSDSATKRMNVI